MTDYGFSDVECKIILNQIERRSRYRKEFLKMRTDPCKHSMEAGYVFDPALQRFMSLKTCQFDTFKCTLRNGIFALCTTVLPMIAYGALIYNHRAQREHAYRCGQIKYRDRMFKGI